jgi:glutamate/tyrosine decarboxylase-like PLP-dependent enzyme
MNYFSVLEQFLPQLKELDQWRNEYGESASDLEQNDAAAADAIGALLERLKGNYPFHHPAYAGQMLKPPHPVAWLAYLLTATINPNNHALDGGPPTSEMEKEVMQQLAAMIGYDKERFLGHLTSGGTMANLEALWVASRIHPGLKIAYSANAHYTHSRMCEVIRQPHLLVPLDEQQLPDLNWLKKHHLEIGTLVITLGTTGLGIVEPLAELADFCESHGIRMHIDAAYGGFFTLIKDHLPSSKHWEQMHRADSIVIDPHKHGLQPYGCGAVLFNDPDVARFYQHDSPYTYFSSEDLHLGEISLECSRAGAAAVALWTTLQCFPLKENEGFGPIMKECRKAALNAFEILKKSSKLKAYKKPELDILGYFPSDVKTTSDISIKSKEVFDAGMKEQTFYLSLFKVPCSEFVKFHPEYEADTDTVTILRSVFMKPDHESFIEELMARVESHL